MNFKQWILFFTGTVLVISTSIYVFGKSINEPYPNTRYFLESGDSVICSLEFGTKLRQDGFKTIGRLVTSNDSIYLEGKSTFDKYGDLSKSEPNQFIATFKDHIVNKDQLIKFINSNSKLFEE